MQTIDLDSIDKPTEVTFDVPVAFDAEGTAIAGFTVVGKDSSQYRAAKRAQDVIAVKKSMQRGKGPDAKTDVGASQFLDEGQAREIATVTACVVGWYGFSRAGVAIVCSAAEVSAVLAKRPTWLEKVGGAIATDENFTQG